MIRALLAALVLMALPSYGAQQVIGVGSAANDGTGDAGRTAFQKVNANFTEIYYGTVTSTSGASATILTTNILSVIQRSNSGSAMTDTLPSAVTAGQGWKMMIVNTDATAADTITPTAGTVGGGASFVLAAGQSAEFISDGTNYQVLSGGCASTCAATVTTLTASAAITSNGGLIDNAGITANAGVTVNGSSLTLSGSRSAPYWGGTGIGIIEPAQTFTDTTSSGSPGAIVIHYFETPTITASNPTTYAAGTLFVINGCPIAGTNVTFSVCRSFDIKGLVTLRTGLTVAAGNTLLQTVTATGLITPTSSVGIAGTTVADSPAPGSVGENFKIHCLMAGAASAGSAVSLAVASPGIVNWPSHTFTVSGPVNYSCPINFTAGTGALPTGIVAGTTYYIIGSTVSGDNFQVSDTMAHALAGTNAINFTGSFTAGTLGWIGYAIATTNTVGGAAMTISAGDWDCSGTAEWQEMTNLTITEYLQGIGTSVAIPTIGDYIDVRYASSAIGAASYQMVTPIVTENVSVSTTVYLVEKATFSAGTQNAGGLLKCRRQR